MILSTDHHLVVGKYARKKRVPSGPTQTCSSNSSYQARL